MQGRSHLPHQKAWSSWMPFTPNSVAKAPDSPGVYQTRCVMEDGTPRLIRRAFRIDIEGTLEYGETASLKTRLTAIFKTLQPGATRSSHAAIWAYVAFCYDRLFPRDRLEFRFQPTSTKQAAQNQKWRLLTDYRYRFLDMPPLNRNPGCYSPDWIVYMTQRTGVTPWDD